VAHSQTIFSDQVSLDRVANHWVRKTGYMLSKGIQFRKENPKEKYTDVMYPQLIASPMAVLEDIYRFGGPVTDGLLQKFQETEQQNKQYRYGKHTYKLEDFGIHQQDIHQVVNIYNEFLNTLK